MSEILTKIIPTNLAHKSPFAVLSHESIHDHVIAAGMMERDRKFSVPDYICSTLSYVAQAPNYNHTLAGAHSLYKINTGSDISCKCVHKNIVKDKALTVVENIASEFLASVSGFIKRRIKKALRCANLSALLKFLGVDDIILIDGTEVSVRPGCKPKFDCKTKGRKRLDGRGQEVDGAAGIKLHIAYSVVKATYEYVTVTEGVGSEREQVLLEQFHNCLIIMDRGYVDDDLEDAIIASGNQFIIKGKKSMACKIKRAIDTDKNVVDTTLVGTKVSKLPYKGNYDCQVEKKNGSVIRVIKTHHATDNEEDKNTILRTSLNVKGVDIKVIYQLYRIRWQIELFNKCLKSGNGLLAINSTKKTIVMQYILFSLIVALLKTYAAFKAQARHEDEWLSLLKVHTDKGLCKVFGNFICCFITHGRSSIFQKFKELQDNIVEICPRSEISERDRSKLKDLPLLIEKVVFTIAHNLNLKIA